MQLKYCHCTVSYLVQVTVNVLFCLCLNIIKTEQCIRLKPVFVNPIIIITQKYWKMFSAETFLACLSRNIWCKINIVFLKIWRNYWVNKFLLKYRFYRKRNVFGINIITDKKQNFCQNLCFDCQIWLNLKFYGNIPISNNLSSFWNA